MRRKRTIVHVNQHVIKSNRKHGKNDPCLTVKTYKSNVYAHEVEIKGPSKVIYRPDKPLSCGAHVWIETYAKVEIVPQEKTDAVQEVRTPPVQERGHGEHESGVQRIDAVPDELECKVGCPR